MRVFLDTSVLLASLISSGVCPELVKALRAPHPGNIKGFTCVTSKRVLAELKGLEELDLDSPNAGLWTSPEAQAAWRMFNEAYTIAPPAPEPVRCHDQDDGWLLADARQADCDYFVSGDKQMLALYCVGSMRLATPHEMLLWVSTGNPIPRFAAHEDRALHLVTRLKSVHDLH